MKKFWIFLLGTGVGAGVKAVADKVKQAGGVKNAIDELRAKVEELQMKVLDKCEEMQSEDKKDKE